MSDGAQQQRDQARPLSIRSRFLLVSLVTVPAALSLAALFMISVFSANLERRLEAELVSHINTLAASLRFAADGRLERPEAFVDRRFTEAYGGLYWQVGDEASPALYRSQSLWDYTLDLPEASQAGGGVHRYELLGPDDTQLIAQERQIMVPTSSGLKTLRVTAAADRAPLEDASRRIALDILPYLAGLAVFLIGASVFQVFFGLKPLTTLTNSLDRIRERRCGRLENVLPKEFQPVEAAVNRLLDTQAEAFENARARAGDLAHGLKTPLTILSNDALTLRDIGKTEIADEIERLVQQMRAQVEGELARSRIVANANMRKSDADMATIVAQIVRTLQRTPEGEALEWKVEINEPAEVPLDPHDLRELVGNIVENAAKWARREIVITWKDKRLAVTDDGPGVDPEKIRRITERGVRLDSKVPGTGLGLTIVLEICTVYGLNLGIENRQASGLIVTIGF